MIERAARIQHAIEERPRSLKGCFWATCAFLVWVIGIALVLVIIFTCNLKTIITHIGRTALYPSLEQALDATHTSEERSAFSNAFAAMLDEVEPATLSRLPTHMMTALTNVLTAAQDRRITRTESASFCSTVWYRASDGR